MKVPIHKELQRWFYNQSGTLNQIIANRGFNELSHNLIISNTLNYPDGRGMEGVIRKFETRQYKGMIKAYKHKHHLPLTRK